MFQFRAFPPYGYLIHRTVPEYCSGGFPHSEIPGSQLICSSPRLIAACRVLLRLLMPRHSPCALFSFTSKNGLPFFWFSNYAGSTEVITQNCITLRQRKLHFSPSAASGEHPIRFVSSSSQIQTRLRWALNLLKKELFFSNLFSTIAVFKVRSSSEDHALCCLASFLFLCSVFKVHVPSR